MHILLNNDIFDIFDRQNDMPEKILIIDDNSAVLTSLSLLLKQNGYIPVKAASQNEALKMFQEDTFDLVLQDMNFSRRTTGEEGIELLKQLKDIKQDIPVILITAWGSISLAVNGIREGAADFITKPWSNDQILQSVKTALGLSSANMADQDTENITRESIDAKGEFSALIGYDPNFLKMLYIISRISSTDASVLITGESGTGKELIAEAIHKNSTRISSPFVKVNLGGISSTLFESEMFGHIKGAYTDAKQSRKGRFEMADSGTIFLDEVGDIDLDLQVKLLRVLQDRTYEVLGSSVTRTVDVRVISATNRDLNLLVERGEFREDFLYRLNLIAIHVPPLRERIEDIPLLAVNFLNSIAKVYRRHELKINPSCLEWLKIQKWPGNIRQLKQMVERTVLLTSRNTLEISDFELAFQMQQESAERTPSSDLTDDRGMTLDDMEKLMIEKRLVYFEGNVSKIADSLGLSRAALYRRFEKFGIKV